MTTSATELLSTYPAATSHLAATVAAAWSPGRVLIVLDDDPTGTQSVANLPVLTQWEPSDFTWALAQNAPAVYVLTNTRSLDDEAAANRNREIVRNALSAASSTETRLTFVSRGDSTLRGHYPLETDVIASTIAAETGEITDAVVLTPAFPDAGRVTIGGTHYMRNGDDLTPIAETEFARDATFGYASSHLAEYVAEKTQGRTRAEDVIVLDLNIIRAADPAAAIADALEAATNRNGHATPVVADCVDESDLRALALGLQEAENRGKKILYRVGPPFVRGRIGQEIHAPLSGEEAFAGLKPSPAGGLIVVGSHVGVTTRQLNDLTQHHAHATTIEIDVAQLVGPAATPETAAAHLDATVNSIVAALHAGDVITHTSRLLIKTDDPAESLNIARIVSAAVVTVVNRVLKTFPPRFVIAKGGITSSDVAAHGLEIRHATVRGPMLPGIVSLWEPMDGPAQGIPYIVFAGNVGDDESLTAVTRKLSTTF